MEYFELGDLEKFITPKMTEKDAKVIGKQLLEGLQVLHENHLAHRDLKPANIFVTRCAPDWWIKLGDFGILRRISTAQNSMLTRIGTPDYMAPEILFENDDEDQDSPYTLAVDIWSLGCVLFRLLSQQLPFPLVKHLRLYWRSKKTFPTDILIEHKVSEDGASLISEMMKPSPMDRITVPMALLHSWVSIQEPIPALGYLDSSKDNVKDGLDGKSADEGSATESRKCNSVSIPKSNLEDNQQFFNLAIPSHIRNLDNLHKNQRHLPSNSHLTSSQNEKMAQLRRPMPDKEESIFDSSDKNTDLLESGPNLANSYLELGMYKEAMQLFQQMLEAHKRLLGDEHPNTLKVMRRLAKSFTKLGRYQEAMHLHKQTLELRKRILGDEHSDTLESMYNLASSYFHLGQNQEAMHLHKKTLELRKRVLGDEHPDTLLSMNNLAVSYSNLRQHQEAMHLDKQTLELRKRILGDEHPHTLLSMNNLAISYSNLGQHQEAMHLREQTLELRKRVLGDEHPDTLWSMHNLAVSYSNLRQHQEAMHLDKQTLELQKRILGDEHPNTLLSMNNLAVSYSNVGQHQKAMKLGKQTVEAQQRILGLSYPGTLSSARNLARISANGQTRQAEDAPTQSPRRFSRYLQFLKR